MKTIEATAISASGTAVFAAPPTESDGELLGRFADCGDQAAFSTLVERHGPMVLRMCRRMCGGDSHAAEDLAQRVFLDLASRAAPLRTRTSIAGWLYRTSWHVSCRYRRDHATREAHECEAGALRGSDDAHEGIPFAVITAELSDALSRALATLPESHRDALVLHYFAGYTVEEAAHVLGVRIGTAASWLSRGRGMLRDYLQRQGLTLATNVVEAWLGAESARMLLRPPAPTEQPVHALACQTAPPVATTTAVTVTPWVAGAEVASSLSASGALAGAGTIGFSRLAISVLTGVFTIGAAGIATAAVAPGGFNALLHPFSSNTNSSLGVSGGSTFAETAVSRPNADAAARSGASGFSFSSAGAAGSVPEPAGIVTLAGIAALSLIRRQRR